MPQSWYQQLKAQQQGGTSPTQPTPVSRPNESWYEKIKRERATQTPNPPPTLEGGGIMDTLGSLASEAGSRIGGVAKSLWSMTPAGQMGQSGEAYRRLQTDPAGVRREIDQYGKDLETELQNPYSVAQTAAGMVDPTGTVPGYMALGRSAVGNIRDQNYGGLATDVGLAALPYGIGKAWGKLTRGVKPELLPKAKNVNVVPDVEPVSAMPTRGSAMRGLTAEAQDATQTPVRDGIFGPKDLTNETALLEQSRLRPQSRNVIKPIQYGPPRPPVPPVVQPTRQLTEFAGVDPRTAEGQAEAISRRQAGQRLALPAPTPPIENPGTARFVGSPTGQVADAFDLNSDEALDSLNLQRPGTTNPLRDRGVELPRVAPPEPWDFDSLGTRQVEEPYNLPRSQGVQSVTSQSKGKFKDAEEAAKADPGDLKARGEVTGRPSVERGPTKKIKVKYIDEETGKKRTRIVRVPVDTSPEVIQAIKNRVIRGGTVADYLDDGDMLYATVPNRLRPEAPNVTRLRGMSQGYGKQGARAAEEGIEIIDEAEWQRRNYGKPGKTVELGEGLTARPRNPKFGPVKEVMQESAPVKGSIDRWKAVPLSEAPPRIPVKAPSFESGTGSIDRNRLTPIQNRPMKELMEEVGAAEKARLEAAPAIQKKALEDMKANYDKVKGKAEKTRQKWEAAQQKKAAKKLGLSPTTPVERMERDLELQKSPTAQEHFANKAGSSPEKKKGIMDRIRGSAAYDAVYKPLAVSGSKELEQMGPGGAKLAKELNSEATESARHAGEVGLADIRNVQRTLTKAEQLEMADILDGKKPLASASNDKVKEAVKTLRAGTDRSASEAIGANVRMQTSEGKTVPFQKHQGEWWPHYYDKELFKDTASLEKKLIEAGNSPAKVQAILKSVREKGERFSPSQHTRDFHLEGYDRSLDALEKYHISMSKAITRAKRYGPGDISDANSTLSKLIEGAENKPRARQIVMEYLERGEMGTDSQNKVAKAIVKGTAYTKLSLQGITNLMDLGGSAVNLGVRDTAKAIFKTLKDPHGSADYATKTGALNLIRENLLRETGGGKFAQWTGSNASEKLVRVVEALAGRDKVQRVFEKAKTNPRYLKSLQRFVDGDASEIVKQDKLTEQQLQFASGRAAELTSGVPNRLSLSSAYSSKNPLVRLPLLLKRFAFLNTKNMVDAVKAEPDIYRKAIKAGTILLAYQGTGELSGDAKAAIKGLVTGDIGKAIDERGENAVGTGNHHFDRIMANYMQSALFGFPGDVAESVSRKTFGKVTGTMGGPVGADLDEFATALASSYRNEDTKAIQRSVVRRTPILGAGLAEKFYPRDEKKASPFGNMGNLGKPAGFGR